MWEACEYVVCFAVSSGVTDITRAVDTDTKCLQQESGLCPGQDTDIKLRVYKENKYKWRFLFNKTNRRTNFANLFLQETLHVSGSSSAHHQEFYTVHSALVYVMQVWWQLSSTTRSCLKAVIKPAWHIRAPNVQWKTPDDEQRNCPKHAEFLEEINLRN
jgi:hypothetical protein